MDTFDLSLLGLVDILLVICDNSFWQCLSDGVDLRDLASTSHSDSDIKVLESLEPKKKNGFEDLCSEGLRLEQFDW